MMRKSILALISLLTVSLLGGPTRSSIGAAHILHEGTENVTTYTAADYVQDGLAYLWDGIENVDWGEHDPSATYWTELISGSTVSISGTYGSSFGWDDDSLVNMTYGNRFRIDITSQMLVYARSGTFSYEVVTSKPTDSAGWNAQTVNIAPSASTAYNYGISIMKRKEANGYVDIDAGSTYKAGGYLIPEDASGLHTTTVVYDGNNGYFMVDAKPVKDTGRQIVPDDTIESVILRFPASNYSFRGHYHCLRIYNRPLTEAEVKWNAAIDQARFSAR